MPKITLSITLSLILLFSLNFRAFGLQQYYIGEIESLILEKNSTGFEDKKSKVKVYEMLLPTKLDSVHLEIIKEEKQLSKFSIVAFVLATLSIISGFGGLFIGGAAIIYALITLFKIKKRKPHKFKLEKSLALISLIVSSFITLLISIFLLVTL